jgi:hypothetical protein
MKTRDIETFMVGIGGQNRVHLRVLTDEHLRGTGVAYCVGANEATVKTIHYFKGWLVQPQVADVDRQQALVQE